MNSLVDATLVVLILFALIKMKQSKISNIIFKFIIFRLWAGTPSHNYELAFIENEASIHEFGRVLKKMPVS